MPLSCTDVKGLMHTNFQMCSLRAQLSCTQEDAVQQTFQLSLVMSAYWLQVIKLMSLSALSEIT